MLMTLVSTLHNLSRSIGYALLAASGGMTMVLSVVGGEMMLYLMWKVVLSDFLAWFPFEGPLGVFASLLYRVIVKVVADFSGCLHFR